MHLVGPPILQQRQCLATPPLIAGKPPILAKKQPLTVPQNPCAQFFFSVNPDTPQENLTSLLSKSWEYDPLTTLKLICYLRTLREERKSQNEGFYIAALWLHKNHPLTLACNLREFASFGSLRDFPEILNRLVNLKANIDCDQSSLSRDEKERECARRAVCKYVQDPAYRFLHERTSELFADLLKSDLDSLKSGNVESLSFASIDCPSIDSSCDRHTLICESIAKKVFPKDLDPDYMDMEDVHYVYRVRNRLRKEVLGPLRTALDGKVAQRDERDVQEQDHTFMKKAYQKMLKMKDKKSKLKYYQMILAMILKSTNQQTDPSPLRIMASLNEENSKAKEAEWQNMVEVALSKNMMMRNSLAVCDVSASMNESMRNVSISMALLISELSSGPWKGTVYGFNELPKLYEIEGDDLRSKVNFMKQLKCTDRVNMEAILNQILQLAERHKLSSEKMVKRVFVFTNKAFTRATNTCWGWNYRAVWEKYQKFGYDFIPEIVFWNIAGFNVCPPTTRHVIHNSLLTINGFSRSLLAFFLDKAAFWRLEEIKSITTAEDVMRITLSRKQYQNLVVLD